MQYANEVLSYVASVAVIVGGFVFRYVFPYLKEKVGEKNLSNVEKKISIAQQQIAQKQGIAYDAVRFAADAYKTLGGPEKLDKAINWAVNKASSLGITTTKQEMEDAIRVQFQNIYGGIKNEVAPVTDNTAPETSGDVKATDNTATQANTAPPVEATKAPAPETVKEVEKKLTDLTTTDLKKLIAQVVSEQANKTQQPAPAQPQQPAQA